MYRIHCTNPFMHGVCEAWNGTGYTVSLPYLDAEYVDEDPRWKFTGRDGETALVVGPREFRHTFSNVINRVDSERLQHTLFFGRSGR